MVLGRAKRARRARDGARPAQAAKPRATAERTHSLARGRLHRDGAAAPSAPTSSGGAPINSDEHPCKGSVRKNDNSLAMRLEPQKRKPRWSRTLLIFGGLLTTFVLIVLIAHPQRAEFHFLGTWFRTDFFAPSTTPANEVASFTLDRAP